MPAIRSSVDAGRLSALAARPGIDPRVWLTLATVTDIGFDPNEGIFVDVKYQPGGEPETAYLGSGFIGNGFGSHAPVKIDDTVLVAIPMGDPGNGPIIIARFWNSGDPPPAEISGMLTDLYLRAEPGQKIYVRTSGSGDGIDIQVGQGHYVVQAAGQVRMQAANQSFVRGEDLKSAIDNFATQVGVAFSAMVPPGPPTTPVTAAQISAGLSIIQTAIQALQAASNIYLSQKIKGE